VNNKPAGAKAIIKRVENANLKGAATKKPYRRLTVGISPGGWLCLRAAAFEPRIKWVISTGGAYDYYKIPPAIARLMMDFFKKYIREGSNKVALKGIKKGGMEAWRNSNIMYITKIDIPMDAFEYAWQMNRENLHADKIRQDVIVITVKDDRFIPFKLHAPLIKSLTNAKSVTDIVYTKTDTMIEIRSPKDLVNYGDE